MARMPELHALLVFAAASLVLIVVPGPGVIYIVTRSLGQGRAAGLVSMLGVEAGNLVHVAAAAIGLSAVLASSAEAFTVVKYAGAAYLLYLGIRALLSRGEDVEAPASRGRRRLFWQGLVVAALNPKTALFFLAFLPQFMDPSRGSVALQAAVLGALFVALATLSDAAYAVLAGSAGGWLRRRLAHRGRLARISGGVYIALGAAAALSGEPRRAE